MSLEDNYALFLISNFTHQAINPLNGVIGTLDNLIDGTISSEDRKMQRLKSARAQLEYTVSLIRNLAFFAQYSTEETGNAVKNTNKSCIIPQLVIEAAQFFQEQGAVRNISIKLLDRKTQNAVKGPPDLLRQVFMNLLDNAVKYGKNNSIIEVKQWIQKGGGNLIVEFAGESIPFSREEDIFAVGIRGKHAEEITSSGTGLGLHICKLIIERVFNGKIEAEYQASTGKGVFRIRIPNAFLNSKENK